MSELEQRGFEILPKMVQELWDMHLSDQAEIDRLTAELADLQNVNRGANNEILRLQELVPTTVDDWTPITSVEQVEALAAGFYELRDTMRRAHVFSMKTEGMWKLSIGNDHFCNAEIEGLYRVYKLIRAFEPAPSIPEGAIENTLENRSKAGKGYYLFHFNDGDNLLFYRGDFEFWHYEGEEYIDASPLMDTANYFQQLDADKFNAALEALAKGEQS